MTKSGSRKKGGPPKSRKPSEAQPVGGVTKASLCESVAQLRTLEKDKDDTVKSLRDQRKIMKGQGIDLEVMDLARKFNKFDEATRAIKLQTLAWYLQAMNLMPGETMDLFGGSNPALANDDGDIADHKGRMAARQFAAAKDNPYSPDDDNHAVWEKARAEEAADMEQELSGGNTGNGSKAKSSSKGKTTASAEAAPVH